jgi:hypothetical protein
MPEAQRLKELLAEAGIAATIVDEGSQEAAGTDPLGLRAPIGVAVDEAHALPARRIAMDFDEQVCRLAEKEREALEKGEAEKEDTLQEAAATVRAGPVPWPRCPACQTPRLTRCPACQTDGSEFAPAEIPTGTASAETLVLCPECDEPFVPEYACRCHRCGHEFPDGFDPSGASPPEAFNWRVMVTIAALVAVFAAILAYFVYLFP